LKQVNEANIEKLKEKTQNEKKKEEKNTPKNKGQDVNKKKIDDFINRNQKKSKVPIHDMVTYKKKYNIPDSTKVFMVIGGY
jgi:hypothetical protein